MAEVSRVQALLREFTRRFEAGEDVRLDELLAQANGTDRRELAALVDAYLERAPRQAFRPEKFAASPARALVDDLARSLGSTAGAWPVLLPRLRAAARLRRAELVARLAQALGFPGREADVASWYHAMEHGTLDPRGVSDRVLDALAAIVGSTREALRAAGEGPGAGGGAPAEEGSAFARTASPDPAYAAAAPVEPEPDPARSELVRGPDELAALFLAGEDPDDEDRP